MCSPFASTTVLGVSFLRAVASPPLRNLSTALQYAPTMLASREPFTTISRKPFLEGIRRTRRRSSLGLTWYRPFRSFLNAEGIKSSTTSEAKPNFFDASALRRLVVIGADGFVSLGALRWLADRNASFVMLDRVGEVLATTGPVRSSDARLRRAQALAHQSGTALEIARSVVQKKLFQQERVLCERFHDSVTANIIEQ